MTRKSNPKTPKDRRVALPKDVLDELALRTAESLRTLSAEAEFVTRAGLAALAEQKNGKAKR